MALKKISPKKPPAKKKQWFFVTIGKGKKVMKARVIEVTAETILLEVESDAAFLGLEPITHLMRYTFDSVNFLEKV